MNPTGFVSRKVVADTYKRLATRIRSETLSSSCIFHRVPRSSLLRVYVRPILRDHVCVRAAAIQISPLGYTSLQTDTARAAEMGAVNGFASSTLLPTRRSLRIAIRIYSRPSILPPIRQLATRNNRYRRLSISTLVRGWKENRGRIEISR